MTKNPLYNALLAISYIVVLVSAVNFAATHLQMMPDSLFLPMSVLATLVLSVALMGYLFFYQPVLLLLDGQREKAVTLFLQTVGIFAVLTGIVLMTAFLSGSRPQALPSIMIEPAANVPVPVEPSDYE